MPHAPFPLHTTMAPQFETVKVGCHSLASRILSITNDITPNSHLQTSP